jgi:TP901 family phage tail tape measure protein
VADRIKGITLEIGGDTTGLSKALSGVNSEIRNTQSQLKDVERLLKLDPSNTELLKQKQKLLADAVAETKGKLDTLKEANKQAAESASQYDAWKAKYDPIKSQIDDTKKKLTDLKNQSKEADDQLARGEISQEKYDALQAEIKETSGELRALQKSAKEVSDEFGNPISPEQYDALQREIIETEEKLESLENQARQSGVVLEQIGLAGDKFQEFGGKVEGAGKKLLPVTAAVAGVGTAAVKTTADFDASMSKVAAISGATGDDFARLREKAREMGAETKFSASEAADAFQYMAMAGWKTEDMLSGIEGIMNLAAASGEDLALTSDIVTDALTAFGLSADDSGHFADILASASSNANTNVSMMGETFKYVAPVAGALGFSAEDTSVAIGLMANSGIKASQAGTSLRQILTNLGSGVELVGSAFAEAGEETGKFHVETVNSDGTMRSLNDIIVDLREGFSGLTDAEKAANAESIAGKVGMSGLLAIVNASEKDFDKLTESVETCDGTSKKMAETMQDNLSGQFTILMSQLQELAISIGDILMPTIREIVSHIQAWVDRFNGLDESTKRTIVTVGLIVAAIGPLLMILGNVITGIGGVMKAISVIGPALSGIKAAITGVTVAIGGVSVPVLAVIAAIAGLIAIFAHLYQTNNEFRAQVQEVWSQIQELIAVAVELIQQLITAFVETGKKLWESYGTGIKEIISSAFEFIKNVISTALTFISDLIKVVMAVINGDWSGAWQAIKTLISNLSENIKTIVKSWMEVVKNTIKLALQVVKDIFENLKTAVTDIVGKLKELAIEKFTELKDKAVETFANLKDALFEKVGAIKDTIIDGIGAAVDWIKDLPGQALEWGKDFIQGFIDGIASMIEKVKDVVGDVAEAVSDFLHFSRPEVGPLHYYEEWMPDMMKGLAAGIRGNMWRVTDQLKELTGQMSVNMQVAGAGGKPGPIIVRNYNQTFLDGKLITESINEHLGEAL